ncbi:PREDICTED: angiopoietin-4 [Myotis davidii]|uniref:angiopoietin-4 n=1 Tax=Myotis davidii TaxID=225400 RepID=UPI0007671D8D|nr:PREDICTED: angiopoietin-4 [Myotis davidii]
MLSWPAMLLGGLLLTVATLTVAQRRGQEVRERRLAHRVQHGQCSYTFLLPEPEACAPETGGTFRGSNSLQRDSLNLVAWPTKRMQHLEKMLENNTQRLQKLERYIQTNLRSQLAQARQHVVQNQTAAVLELGTSLLNQTTAQAHRLTDMEAQVLNQTSRMEIQMQETSLSTNKLEKQLFLQGLELHRLQDYNSALETRLRALETQQQAQLASLRQEKERLGSLLSRQNGALAGLARSLRAARSNSSLLQRQQDRLLESMKRLLRTVAQGPSQLTVTSSRKPSQVRFISLSPAPPNQEPGTEQFFLLRPVAAERVFQDCAEIQSFGANTSGIYTIHVANMTEPRKVFCDMEANGGGWTLIQRRANGSVNFQRNWKDYKQGFGDLAGEHWLGNELVHHLTSRAAYSLRVELQDWEGNEAYAQYERFQLGSEGQLYRLSLSGYSGSAGPQSSLALEGTNFSTRDADNDNCLCKCAQMLSGGWWFDACGLSNLNGIYYPAGRHLRKLNGIRWHYFQGPSYSLRATRMMVRPIGT